MLFQTKKYYACFLHEDDFQVYREILGLPMGYGFCMSNTRIKVYYKDQKIHKEDGPAVLEYDHSYYHFNGTWMRFEEWEKKVNDLQNKK